MYHRCHPRNLLQFGMAIHRTDKESVLDDHSTSVGSKPGSNFSDIRCEVSTKDRSSESPPGIKFL